MNALDTSEMNVLDASKVNTLSLLCGFSHTSCIFDWIFLSEERHLKLLLLPLFIKIVHHLGTSLTSPL